MPRPTPSSVASLSGREYDGTGLWIYQANKMPKLLHQNAYFTRIREKKFSRTLLRVGFQLMGVLAPSPRALPLDPRWGLPSRPPELVFTLLLTL